MSDKRVVTFEAERTLARQARIAAAVRGESRSALLRRALERELRRLMADGLAVHQEHAGETAREVRDA